MCTLHVYKTTVRPVASSSLFFDLQVVTLLLAECTLFARANPLPGYVYIFQQYLQHTCVYIHVRWAARAALSVSCKFGNFSLKPGRTCTYDGM